MSYSSSFGGPASYSLISVVDPVSETSVPITNQSGTVNVNGNLSSNYSLLSSTPFMTISSLASKNSSYVTLPSSLGVYIVTVYFTVSQSVDTTITTSSGGMDCWTLFEGNSAWSNNNNQTIYNTCSPRYSADTTIQTPPEVQQNVGYSGINNNAFLTLIPQSDSSEGFILFYNISTVTLYNINIYLTRLC